MNRVINPPAALIGKQNVIFTGTAFRHYAGPVFGSASVKSVVRGEGRWYSNDKCFRVQEGTWLLLNDGDEYTLEIDSLSPVTTFCVFFRVGYLGDALRYVSDGDGGLIDNAASTEIELAGGLRPRGSSITTLLLGMREAIRGDVGEAEDWFARIARSVVADHRARRRARDSMPARKAAVRAELQHRVQRAIDFILSNLREPVTTDQMAREACLSPFHFHRVFARHVGETPYQFLRRQRLLHAAALLRDRRLTLADIATEAGFESITSFVGAFRAQFGLPPARYRRERYGEGHEARRRQFGS
jgi:AraC-like DNA-binding protein